MIGGRRRGRGFSRRAPATGAAFSANVKVTNTDVASYFGPVDFGLAINPTSFNTSTERLADSFTYAQATGNDTTRWVRATKFVTVNASSDQIITINKESGAQATPATKTLSDLLALDATWTPIFTFTDTSDVDWEVDVRDVFANGTTTFGVANDYIAPSYFRNTINVKEQVFQAPFRRVSDGVAHDRLALQGSAIFYSNDDFTTRHSIKLDVALVNPRLFSTGAERLAVVGELVVTINGGTVSSHTRRAIGDGSYSTTDYAFTGFSTASFTSADKASLLIGNSGAFEMPVYDVVSGEAINGYPGSTGAYSNQSITGATLWPVWIDPGAMLCVPLADWPNANPLVARQKTQEIRDNMLFVNSKRIRPILSVFAHGTGLMSATVSHNLSPSPGQYNRNESNAGANMEIREDAGQPILNNVDGDGYITPATYDFLIRSDELTHGIFRSAFFQDDTTGLFSTTNWRSSSIYDGGKWYGYQGGPNSHNSLMNFATWALTGRWTQTRALYMHAKAQRRTNYSDGDTKNVLYTGFVNLVQALSGGARAMGNNLWLNALYAKSMPKTTPSGCLLPATNDDVVNYLNRDNFEESVDMVGVDTTPTEPLLPAWSAGMPFVYKNEDPDTNWSTFSWTQGYVEAATIELLESGILSTKSIKMASYIMRARVGGLVDDYYTSTLAQKHKIFYRGEGLKASTPSGSIPDSTAQTPAAFWQFIVEGTDLEPEESTNYAIYMLMNLLWVKHQSDMLVNIDTAQLQDALNVILAEANVTYGIPLTPGGDDIDYANWTVPDETRYTINYVPRS